MWRIEHRLNHMGHLCRLDRPFSSYLRENFYVTTSGFFDDPALGVTLTKLGPDRILFASDYPFESMTDATRWLDEAPLRPQDRAAIAYGNAARLLRLKV
jgi:2,3-dihydroxybenzoate decarboxylase